MKTIAFALILVAFCLTAVNAQPASQYNFDAQKKFIPAELGEVYLGMPFDKFAGKISLSCATVGDTRFDWLELSVPFDKGNLAKLTVRIYGLSAVDKQAILKRETVQKKDELGYDYEDEIDRLLVDNIPAKGFVYAFYIEFKKDFDLKQYVLKTYGADGEVRKPDDKYHFFDIQWTKKTPDDLSWLIRSFHESEKSELQLFGRIDDTEWGLD